MNRSGEQQCIKLLELFDWYLLCGTCSYEYKQHAGDLMQALVVSKVTEDGDRQPELAPDAERIQIIYHSSVSLRTHNIALPHDQIVDYMNAFRDIAVTITNTN
ncbi:unnamed protein product [Ceutorhynchus assimilis]|uniref:Uncharacterized protein n=1 Tax=Ceutorhynchus assimilis TaxID=467358 RepID=A0A9N9MZ77_9CUCU|nr:unnamed protein product [Ceutorhynchus assimilis]